MCIRDREKLRPVDVLARLGGDEFGVLLPGIVELESAVQTAERLRRSIEAFIFGWEGRTYTISASTVSYTHLDVYKRQV